MFIAFIAEDSDFVAGKSGSDDDLEYVGFIRMITPHAHVQQGVK